MVTIYEDVESIFKELFQLPDSQLEDTSYFATQKLFLSPLGTRADNEIDNL